MAENRMLMGCVLAVAASAALTSVANGATNIAEYVCLAADADWRGRGTVVVQKGAAIDLAGRTLKVDGIAGGFASPVDATTSSGAVEASTIYSGNSAFLFDDDIRYMADSVFAIWPTRSISPTRRRTIVSASTDSFRSR